MKTALWIGWVLFNISGSYHSTSDTPSQYYPAGSASTGWRGFTVCGVEFPLQLCPFQSSWYQEGYAGPQIFIHSQPGHDRRQTYHKLSTYDRQFSLLESWRNTGLPQSACICHGMWCWWGYTHSACISTGLSVRPISLSAVLLMLRVRPVQYCTAGTTPHESRDDWHLARRYGTSDLWNNSFQSLNYDVSFQDAVGCITYSIVTSWCLQNGPDITPILREELISISLRKLYSIAFDSDWTSGFWKFLSIVFAKLHNYVVSSDNQFIR